MQRSLGLDILRSFAILFVILCHSVYIIYPVIPQFIGNVLLQYGLIGVDLFFVLSGFLIGRIFIKEVIIEPGNYVQKIRRFWKRRWFRTLPNYYLFLLIHLVLMMIGFGQDSMSHTAYVLQKIPASILIRFPFFLQNLVTLYPDFFAQSWSLAVEEWFYLILPVFFYLILKANKNLKGDKLNAVLLFTIVLLIIWKSVSYFFIPSFYAPGKVVYNFDQIMIGVLLGNASLNNTVMFFANRLLSFIIAIAAFLSANILMFKIHFAGSDLISRIMFTVSFAFSLISFLDLKIREGMISRIIEWFSKISYSVYLCHMLVLYFLVDVFLFSFPFFKSSSLGLVCSFVLFLVTTILLSSIVFVFFEQPLMKLRDYSFRKNES